MRRMDKTEIIKKMRGRVEQCRRLAAATLDEQTALVLRQMADEGQADIDRLMAEEN